jgi:glutamine amidotransferase
MISIVDYDAGNLTSVQRALTYLEIPSCIVASGAQLADVGAERIIFPGVGHARAAMRRLRERALNEALREAFEGGTPILGICLGAQIVLSHSEEGDTPCLDLIPGRSSRFDPSDSLLKVPHMGWNNVRVKREHPVLQDVEVGSEFYFVHSYYPLPRCEEHVLATSEYGIRFPAVVGYRNLIATQFHPEKSGRVGLALLRRFGAWDGTGFDRGCGGDSPEGRASC